MNDPDQTARNTPLEVRSYFVRHRNALVVRAEFGPLYTDYYLHLMQHGLRYQPAHDAMLKEALAALTLHLCSRPRNEGTAWTFNFQEPLLNLFVTGSNPAFNVTGRAFEQDVKRSDASLFYSQTTREGEISRKSAIEFEGSSVFEAVETYYRQSEQRPARYFRHSDEDFVMVTAQPDCDMPWFLTLDDQLVLELDQTEELSLLETRNYYFECGCNEDRIYPIINTLSPETQEELFDETGEAIATCPRCGAKFTLTRAGLEAHRSSGVRGSRDGAEDESGGRE